MKLKLTTIVIGLLFFSGLAFGQKGITNNGAKIVVTSGGIINITGGTDADYTNKTSGGTDGRIDLDGKIKLEGDWNNNATSGEVFINVDNDGEVVFDGTAAQVVGGTSTTRFEKLTLVNASGLTLANNTKVESTLSLTDGRITIGSTKNLTLGVNSNVTGTFSSGEMIVATSGELRKEFSSTGSFTFPVGDVSGTAEYSPVTLNFTSGSFGSSAYAGIQVTDLKHPNNLSSTGYITRYWTLDQSNISSFSCNVSATYLTADVFGTESNLFAGHYNSPNWVKMDAANTVSNLLTGTMTEFYDVSGGDMAMFCANSPAIASTVVDVSCNGGANGTINLTVSGGLAPYSYSWSTLNGSGLASASEDQSGLSAGTYDVTVTDQNGCSSTSSIIVDEPNLLTSGISGVDILCNGDNTGSVDLTVSGGTSPFSYIWSSGDNTQDISGLNAGTYNVTVSDFLGCQTTNSITLVEPQPISSIIIGTDVSCYGGNDGSADLTVSGGTPGYSYSWSTGATVGDISGLSANTYNLTITDNNSCTVTDNITINQPLELNLTFTSTNVSCNGGANGSIDLTPGGGTSPYTQIWSNAATTEDISGLTAGTYSVTVTDNHGCQITGNKSVTAPTSLTASIVKTDALCNGSSDGTANLTVGGGTSPYSYAWSNAATSEDLSGLSAGTYSATITDGNSCQITTSTTINEPAGLSLTITGTDVNCNGGSNGSATISIVGGTPAYTYLWNTGQTSGNISGLSAATYTLTVTDNHSCTVANSVTINEPAALTASITNTDASCYGYNDGIADLTVTGGTGPYEYAWSTGETTEDIVNLTAGNYSVTVTDFNNCTTNTSDIINQPTEIALTTSAVDATCGLSDGSATVSASGGAGSYTYNWDDPLGQNTATAGNLGVGTYNVTVYDAAFCENTAQVGVSEVGAPSLAVSSVTDVQCYGGSDGIVTVTVSAGTPNFTYSWSNGSSTSNTPITTNTVSGLSAGNHSVTVTDAGGCIASISVNVTQPTQLIASITGTNLTCNSSCDGTATVIPSGGAGGYSYEWNSGSPITQTATNLCAGVQTVTITDVNGCTLEKTKTLTEPAELTASILGTDVNCNGESNGAAELIVAGGTPTYSYNWSNGNNTENISGLAAGSYSVTVNDVNSCEAIASITINEPLELTTTISSFTDVSCYGNCDGSAGLNVAGGTGAYYYSWSSGGNTAIESGLCAGIHTVTVTDDNGCEDYNSVSITEPTELSASFINTNLSCNNSGDGEIDLTVSGGTPGYSFEWSNTETTEDILNLNSGTYSVTINDTHGCEVIANSTITQPTPLTSNFTVTNVQCYGGADGSINLIVNGGTPSYSYLWNEGTTTDNLSNITAGAYSVTITDANNCELISNTNVTEPVELTASILGEDISCYGANDGSATISVSGGTPSYSYAWDHGATSGNISGLAPAIYTLTVSDAYNCEVIESVTISEPALLTSSLTGIDVNCFGNSDGSIDLVVSGGTTPHNYLWSNANTVEDISNIPAGNYYVTISDANGCEIEDSYTINEPTELLASLTATDVACYGENTGDIDLTVSGGTPTYNYAWDNGESTQDITNLLTGIYTVTISDANNCEVVVSEEIFEPTVLTSSVTTNDALCYGSSNGSAEISVTGGTPTYSYLWNTGASSSTISGLAAGSYSVTVTDQNNCEIIENATIDEPVDLLLSSAVTDASCFGSNDGAIDITVSGGTSNYAYSWDNGLTTEDISNVSAGDYIIDVTDAHGCNIQSTIVISEPDEILLTFVSSNAHCGQADGEATVSVNSGGQSPFSFVWDTGQSGTTVTGIYPGIYEVTVTDDTGCQNSASVVINNIDPPTINVLSINDVTCFGSCNGSAEIEITGGELPYTIAWDDPLAQSSEILSNVCEGTYNVLVTDASNCVSTTNVIVNSPDEIVGSINTNNVSCYSFCDGSATVSVIGGTQPYSYNWTGGETTSSISNLCAGDYDLTITDANSCSILKLATITEPDTLSSNYLATDVSCNSLTDGSIDLSILGGTSPYSVEWSNNEITEDLIEIAAGTYYMTITDDHSCEITDSVEINEPEPLELTSAVTDNLCNGYNQGEIDLTITGGVTPYSFSWNNGETSEDLVDIAAGSYSVVVSDANNCDINDNFVLTDPDAINISYVVTHEDLGSDGEIDITVTGGTGSYSYSWSNAETTEDIVNLVAGIYSVTVQDDNSCLSTSSIAVNNVGCNMTLSLNATDLSCYNNASGEVIANPADGTEPYNYNWSDGQSTQTSLGLSAGMITVTVTDDEGCVAIDSVELAQPDSIQINATLLNVSCYGADNGEIYPTVVGGTEPFSFEWSNGATTQDIFSMLPGVYELTATDINGCTNSDAFEITEPDELTASDVTSDVSCFSGNNGSIDITAAGGTPPYSFEWNNGSSNEDIAGLIAGEYSVIISDNNNCNYYDTITIEEPLEISITSVISHENAGNDGAIDITVTGGISPYSYLWNNSETTEDLSGISAGLYEVTVTDANVCQNSMNFSVNDNTCIMTTTVSTVDVSCYGGNTGEVSVVAENGTEPYSYTWSDGQNAPTALSLFAGNYTVTVEDANGCVIIENATISEPTELLVDYSVNDISCYGSADGAITATVSGGTSPYTILWSNGESSESIANLSADSYMITVTDDNGCNHFGETILMEPEQLNLSLDSDEINCNGTASGEIDATVTGGSGSYNYAWSNGEITEDLANIYAGNYSLTVTDDNGCSTEASTTVTETEEIIISYVVTNEVDGSDGAIDITVTGGLAPYEYSWSNGETTEDITALVADVYEVSVTDLYNCIVSELIPVNDSSCHIDVVSTVNNITCFGADDGSISIQVSNSYEPYTVIWSNGETTDMISDLSAGTYQVTVEDANGCLEMVSGTVSEPGELLTEASITDVLCNGGNDGSIMLSVSGGTQPYSFNWNTTESTESITDLAANNYSVTVTDNNGCNNIGTYSVNEPELLEALLTIDDVLCNGGNSGAIDITVTGGIAPYSYNWNNGETTEDLSSIEAGTYDLTITDGNNCSITESAVISEPDQLSISYLVTDEDAGNDGAIDVTVAGGTSPYVFSWSNGETTEDLSGLSADIYNLTVTDDNLCNISETMVVNMIGCNLSITTNSLDPLCNGDATGEAYVSASGGTAPFSYEWNNSQTTDTITNLFTGNYSVTVTDANSCADVGYATISEPEQINAEAMINDITCFGEANGEISLDITGGVEPYDIIWSTMDSVPLIDSLASGSYSFTVTDANACQYSNSLLINEPDSLQLMLSAFDVLCFNENSGSINLSVFGGNPPYSYQWNNGAVNEDIMDLAAGYYEVSVYDANACLTVDSISITEPSELIIDAVITDENTGNDGAIDLTVSGGTPGYEFIWATGETTEDISGLASDIYIVTVSDVNGCNNSSAYAVNNILCNITTAVTTTDALCFGEFSGEAYVEITNGTEPYSIEWSDGQVIDTAYALTAGNYSLTVTDDAGCISIDNFTIYEPTPLTLSLSSTDDYGTGDGTATAMVTGGTSPYEYLWNDNSAQITETAIDLDHGFYTVTVTDNNSCIISDSVEVLLWVSIDDLQAGLSINVYPNPVKEQLNLVFHAQENYPVKIYLVDMNGKQITHLSKEIFNGENRVSIDMHRYASGLYYIKIVENGEMHSIPIVKSDK